MSDMKTKAAVYVRVTVPEQAAADQQKERVLQFAEAHGHKVYKVYTDLGYSGLDFERPALLQMKLDAADGMIDAILLDKVSCLGKDMEKISMWIAAVAQKGIEVIPVDLGRSYTPQAESIVKFVKQMDLMIREQEEKAEKTKTPRSNTSEPSL